MDNAISSPVQAGFIVLSLLCVGLLFRGMLHISNQMPADRSGAGRTAGMTLMVILGWMVVASLLAATGFLNHFDTLPPRLFVVILPPILGLIWLLRRKKLRLWLSMMPVTWPIWLQTFRVFVEILLWLLYKEGQVPIQMTFEGANFDILTGLTAPVVALFFADRPRVIFWWNFAGLLLLLNIVVVAFLSAPTPFRVFMNEPANRVVALFPVVLLPAFLVPLAYYLHAFSISKGLSR